MTFRAGVVGTAVLLVSCGGTDPAPPKDTARPTNASPPGVAATDPAKVEIGAALNRGAGLMGQFRFEAAEAEFARAAERIPSADASTSGLRRLVTRNRAIARLNQSEEGSQERAIELLEPLLASDADDLATHYCIGLARLFLGEPDLAKPHFERVVTARPGDAYALYYLGQCLEFADDAEGAAARYQASAAADPTLRSPLLGMQRLAARAGREAESDEYLRQFQALADNPRARLAEFKYTRMGELAEVALPVAGQADAARAAPSGAIFRQGEWTIDGDVTWDVSDRSTLSAADIDGDGTYDLLAAHAAAGGGNVVLLGKGERRFAVATGHPLSEPRDVRCALWGDVDNDGDTDVYLCRKGENQLLLADGRGGFQAAPATSGSGGGDRDTVDGVMADLDHDGDLDLFLCNADAPCDLLSNNADGTFRSLGERSGASGDGRPAVSVLVNDLDGDRDADIFLIHADPPNELLLNDRLWRYTKVGAGELDVRPLVGAIAGDWDADGEPSLVTVGRDGTLQRLARSGGSWGRTSMAGAPGSRGGRPGVAVADANGDGVMDLLWLEESGLVVATMDGNVIERAAGGGALAWSPFFESERGPAAALLGKGGVTILEPGPGRAAFATLRFAGRTDPSLSMRSNASGIGTLFSARVGAHWGGGDSFRPTSGPGQSLLPVALGLGDAAAAAFVAMEWSDGVYQSEMDLAAGATHLLTETQRQISSCPVIFVWDGTRQRFVTDCLGVGGLGYLVAPGEYAPPRPWERVLFPQDLVPVARDGAFDIRLAEPMEEVCYLDAARLVMIDLPPGWSMTVDERMGLGGPEVTGEPRYYRQAIRPVRAHNAAGRDLTAELMEADGRAAPLDHVDPRFIGYLREPTTVTLEFDRELDSLPGSPTLIAHGWVEYPYCQTNFAAWQAGVTLAAPNLEARGRDGRWTTLSPMWGYPAGMPREMSLPLGDLPSGTTALRMTTNQEIYWDAFLVAGVEPCPEARRTLLPLLGASVHEVGFAERTTHPEKRPDYLYERRLPLWDVRFQPGFYTAFGRCDALLAATDDAVAIFGPGEEIRLRFAAPGAAVDPRGLSESLIRGERRFMLELDGWCKDYDLFTRDGESVGPVPTRDGGASTPETERLHRRFNTRYRDGR